MKKCTLILLGILITTSFAKAQDNIAVVDLQKIVANSTQVKQLKQEHDKKMDELSGMPGYSRQPMETKHTLLSLNITDDYFKAKKQAEIFEQDLQQKDQEMYNLKHELISLRMQIEEVQKHEQELTEQKNLLAGKNDELEKQNNELEKQIDELLK